MERDFKGIWIPKEFYLNPDLSWTEKIILVEIDSLDKDGAGCFASNKYLAKFLMLSEGSVANIIIKLIDRGYLIKKGFDGRKRYISVNSDLTKILKQNSQKDEFRVHKNMNSESIKTLKQTKQKHEHSNTVNKTFNKTITKESKKNFTLIFPQEFSPQIIKIINDYFEYRKEIKKPFKSDKTYLTKIDQFKEQVKKYGEEIVIASINNAIANGWQGTFINDELLKQFTNNQNLVKDAKGNYADTEAGRQQFILDIREGVTKRFIERGLLKERD